MKKISRREFSATLAAVGSTGLAGQLQARPVPAQAPSGSPEELTVYQYHSLVILRWQNQPALAYRAWPGQKLPYIYPFAGPQTGVSLVVESALPWPHHRGIWLGCDRINGHDFWSDKSNETGQIRTISLKGAKHQEDAALIETSCAWEVPGKQKLLHDERKYIYRVKPGIRLLEVTIRLQAETDITIEKTNHSLFSCRVSPELAPDGGGVLVNSEGKQGEKATFGQPARWCAFYGPRPQLGGVVEGIALMTHPENPWEPCPWFTRDYGFMSPTPFNFIEKPWELKAGESFALKYLVAGFTGKATKAILEPVFEQWVSGRL